MKSDQDLTENIFPFWKMYDILNGGILANMFGQRKVRMGNYSGRKDKILIVDDSELNREILSEMLKDEFDIEEAEDGVKAVSMMRDHIQEYSLVLLDIVMPEMDGFEVLAYMNKYDWIEDVPVIMISSENSSAFIRRAYEFGVSDFVRRPFDATIVYRRVVNTVTLYARQRKLMDIVADQIYEKEKNGSLMVSILSHIVEFRNGESGLHVLHINTMTELLLRQLMRRTDRYGLTNAGIAVISTASSLHDIGKISIDDAILNKPGRLTPEEYAIMKTHSEIGASMLSRLTEFQDEPLVKRAYEICRWHHERYDGRGYPDGLKGEEIPISAQIVALADVYDALTSERCYKKAFSHDVAMDMIIKGECGAFNPLLLECLRDIGPDIQKELGTKSYDWKNKKEIQSLTQEMIQHEELSASNRLLRKLEFERMKSQFYAEAVEEITFIYSDEPPVLSLSKETSWQEGLAETIADPMNNDSFRACFEQGALEQIREKIHCATPDRPKFELEFVVSIKSQKKIFRCSCMAIWTSFDKEKSSGVVGRVTSMQDV